MPHALDGPQVDDRPPGYGTTLSFGPLGPSRVAVQINDPPEGYEVLDDTVIVPLLVWTMAPVYVSAWRGQIGAVRLFVIWQPTTINTGQWRMRTGVQLVGTDPAPRWGNETGFNFTWVATARAVIAEDLTFPFGGVLKVAEWQTCSIRFPGCVFAEPF